MMRFDLHSHTKYSKSDGYLEPKMSVKIARKRGLAGIAITDHNEIKGALKAKEFETDDFEVIVGSEIKTERGEIIGLFMEEKIESKDPVSVVHQIKAQNGIVIIPHPFDELRKSAFHPLKDDVKFIEAIEVLNSRCVFQKYNERAIKFADDHGLLRSAGSDAHFGNEIGIAGVEIEDGGIREALFKNKIKVYGKRSSLTYHGLTKALKTWRKIRSG
jgi:predicted metal-dependent phosphoesterase TrpH